MRWCRAAGVAALGWGVATGALAAQGPEERAQARLKVEQRLAALEEQQAQAESEDAAGELQLTLARQYLDLAQRALKWHNVRAARQWADQAERALARVAPAETPADESPAAPVPPTDLTATASEEAQP